MTKIHGLCLSKEGKQFIKIIEFRIAKVERRDFVHLTNDFQKPFMSAAVVQKPSPEGFNRFLDIWQAELFDHLP